VAGKPADGIDEWGASHALKAAHLKSMKVRRVTRDEATAMLGFPAPAGGVLIQYFDLNGEPTGFFRIRFDSYDGSWAKTLGRKALRYAQPPASGVAAYFAPLVNWPEIASDPAASLLITEGEAKGAAACAHDLPCVAFGGVASWHGTKSGLSMLRDLQPFAWKGRVVSIAYDSDATQKPEVRLQENQLATALANEGAHVKVVRLPALPDGTKCGLDDYLIAHGVEELRNLIDATEAWALSRELYELSARYGFVHDIAQVVEYPTTERRELLLFAPETFVRHVEAARMIAVEAAKGGSKTISAARCWIESKSRPNFESLTYAPGQLQVTNGKLNLWSGWGCEPQAGDTAPFEKVFRNVVQNKQADDYILDWVAHQVQHPGVRMPIAVVLCSTVQGIGKTMIAQAFADIFGDVNVQWIDVEALKDKFGEWMVNSQFIIAEEMNGAEGRAHKARVKNLISSEKLRVNRKYKEAKQTNIAYNLLALTNEIDSFEVDETDRRLFIVESKGQKLPYEDYERFAQWRERGGAAALFHHLLKRDLSNFKPFADAPMTEGKQVAIAASRSQIAAWVHEMKFTPDAVSIDTNSVRRQVLSLHTVEELIEMFGRSGKTGTGGVTTALRDAGFKQWGANSRGDGSRPVRFKGGKQRRLWITRHDQTEKVLKMKEGEVVKLFQQERLSGFTFAARQTAKAESEQTHTSIN
jgi:hypothetical protein